MARRYLIERNGLGWIVRGGTVIHALWFLRRGRAVRVAVELERAYHDGVFDERHKDDPRRDISQVERDFDFLHGEEEWDGAGHG